VACVLILLLPRLLLLQGSMLLLLGPWVDAWVSGRWVGSYVMTMPASTHCILTNRTPRLTHVRV
jgi:hypothetical protein